MVTTPDDDTPQTFSPMTPAMPSRAAGEAPLPTMPAPMFEDHPQMPGPARKRPAKKAQRLPAREIKRINRNRRKNVAKKAKSRSNLKKRAPAPKVVEPKNRNRPLEMKNRLHTVLGAVAGMSKAEALALTGVMQHLEDMSRSSRKRVIDMLAQVYA